MFNHQELENYLKKHNVTDTACEYIRMVRDSEPSRVVGRQAGSNVCTGFSSRKMGRTNKTESRTAELPFAIEFEYDNDVLEFWEQPQPISVNRTNKNDQVRPGSYTPDFLLLTTSGPKVVEIKTKENIPKLLEKDPQNWITTSKGVTYRPAKEAFNAIGLNYEVLSTADINLIRTENYKLLLNSRMDDICWDKNLLQLVKKILLSHAWIKLSELAKKMAITDLTPLIQMVDYGELYIAINDELLSQPDSTWVSLNSELVIIGFETRKSEHFLIKNESISIEQIPTEKQAEKALKILKHISNGDKGRSIRRWNKQIQEGKDKGLTPFQSLLPKYYLSGNRTARLNQSCIDFIHKFIKENYSTSLRLIPARAYDLYCELAKNEHSFYPPVSRPTLRQYIKNSNQQKIARGRGGKRAGNAAANPTDVDKRGFLATVPFELSSLDHYLVKQECIIAISNGKTYTARPWLTAMIDVYTKAILAIWLTFRAPSKRSCGMVIRMCARKHGRLPKSIIVDRGSDFQSVYFSSLLGHFEIDNTERPAGHARYGQEIERFFGMYKTQWLALRPGNNAMYTENRAVSGSHTSAKSASLSIEDTWNEVNQYIEWRNNVIVGNEKLSPIDKLNNGLSQFSFVGVKVKYNNDFRIKTAVDAGSYAIDPSRGININGIHFWAPELLQHSTRSKNVDVRHEPENPFHIYAQVNNQWVLCTASEVKSFVTKDPVIQLAEASRILDCRAIRDSAKEEASQALVRTIINIDEESKSTPKIAKKKGVKKYENNITSIFDKLKNKHIEVLKTGKGEGRK